VPLYWSKYSAGAGLQPAEQRSSAGAGLQPAEQRSSAGAGLQPAPQRLRIVLMPIILT
jgi:hypothetical protein